jgi:hypothetical protein
MPTNKKVKFADPLSTVRLFLTNQKCINNWTHVWTIKSQRKQITSIEKHLEVVLDSIALKLNILNITILVANKSFHKKVTVRTSWDNWKYYTDITANFDSSVTEQIGEYRGIDKFCLTIDLNTIISKDLNPTLEFAIKYEFLGNVYWDNNYSQNYNVYYSKIRFLL